MEEQGTAVSPAVAKAPVSAEDALAAVKARVDAVFRMAGVTPLLPEPAGSGKKGRRRRGQDAQASKFAKAEAGFAKRQARAQAAKAAKEDRAAKFAATRQARVEQIEAAKAKAAADKADKAALKERISAVAGCFDGCWAPESSGGSGESLISTIRGGTCTGHDGEKVRFRMVDVSSCSLENDEPCRGELSADGQAITWADGDVWRRTAAKKPPVKASRLSRAALALNKKKKGLKAMKGKPVAKKKVVPKKPVAKKVVPKRAGKAGARKQKAEAKAKAGGAVAVDALEAGVSGEAAEEAGSSLEDADTTEKKPSRRIKAKSPAAKLNRTSFKRSIGKAAAKRSAKERVQPHAKTVAKVKAKVKTKASAGSSAGGCGSQFDAGQVAVLCGLVARPELNGCRVTVHSVVGGSGRIAVKLADSGEHIKVKAENLKKESLFSGFPKVKAKVKTKGSVGASPFDGKWEPAGAPRASRSTISGGVCEGHDGKRCKFEVREKRRCCLTLNGTACEGSLSANGAQIKWDDGDVWRRSQPRLAARASSPRASSAQAAPSASKPARLRSKSAAGSPQQSKPATVVRHPQLRSKVLARPTARSAAARTPASTPQAPAASRSRASGKPRLAQEEPPADRSPAEKRSAAAPSQAQSPPASKPRASGKPRPKPKPANQEEQPASAAPSKPSFIAVGGRVVLEASAASKPQASGKPRPTPRPAAPGEPSTDARAAAQRSAAARAAEAEDLD